MKHASTWSRRAVWLLALLALGTWGAILLKGGVVRAPERKPERAALGAFQLGTSRPGALPARDGDPRSPAERLQELELRHAALTLSGPQPAVARSGSTAAGAAPGDIRDSGSLDAWLAQHPFAGTHRAARRVAVFGAHVVAEGELLPGCGARLVRVEAAAVELEADGARRRVELARLPREDAR